ncbi:MAG: phenylalanine--tRNA ligase subunit alpha, partial [Candidatus Neomarinimicrobiota bacterium]|nr:phenylalanine--tRNA ligase subunit alpha [Candidatus Neomarinimicrobiota bacterium]
MSVLEQLESVRKNFLADLETFPDNPREIGELRSKYLGRKGDVASLFSLMGKASAEERPVLGQKLNALKEEL